MMEFTMGKLKDTPPLRPMASAKKKVTELRITTRMRMALLLEPQTEMPKPNPKELKEQNHLEMVSMTIQPGEEMIVGERLRAILGAARKGKAA